MSLEKINLNFVGIDFCEQLKELYKNYRIINANRMYVIKKLTRSLTWASIHSTSWILVSKISGENFSFNHA